MSLEEVGPIVSLEPGKKKRGGWEDRMSTRQTKPPNMPLSERT